jgi:hypothetical protein
MKHPCALFGGNQPMSYVDKSYFSKPSGINEIFDGGQRFVAKSEFKTKIVYFHIQRNI